MSRALAALAVTLALAVAACGAQTPQERSPALREPTLFLLDEFAALGRLEAVERAMGLMAGYGLQLWPILQDLSQLRALYGARANTFVANAGVLQCFGVNDYETAKALSQLMGQATTAYATTSHRPGDPASTTHQLTGRDLLTPEHAAMLDQFATAIDSPGPQAAAPGRQRVGQPGGRRNRIP